MTFCVLLRNGPGVLIRSILLPTLHFHFEETCRELVCVLIDLKKGAKVGRLVLLF